MAHSLKAADVSDEAVMAAIARSVAERGFAGRGDVLRLMPEYPRKVLYAKMRSMVKRGLIETCDSPGCTCSSLIDPGPNAPRDVR